MPSGQRLHNTQCESQNESPARFCVAWCTNSLMCGHLNCCRCKEAPSLTSCLCNVRPCYIIQGSSVSLCIFIPHPWHWELLQQHEEKSGHRAFKPFKERQRFFQLRPVPEGSNKREPCNGSACVSQHSCVTSMSRRRNAAAVKQAGLTSALWSEVTGLEIFPELSVSTQPNRR